MNSLKSRRPAAYQAAYRERTIRNWVFQDSADRGERPKVAATDERAELQFRRENLLLKVERDILKKPAA